MKKYLMFDLLVTPWIIRILYLVGQLLIIVWGFTSMTYAQFLGGPSADKPDIHQVHSNSIFGGGVLSGFLIIILGSLALRLFFEILMVQFKIAENTSQLKEIMKNNKTE